MTLEEAIEINYGTRAYHLKVGDPDAADAIQLGIEALKWYKQFRPQLDNGEYMLLKGETKE